MDNFGVPPRLDQQTTASNDPAQPTPAVAGDPMVSDPMAADPLATVSQQPIVDPMATPSNPLAATTPGQGGGGAKGIIFGVMGLVVAVGLAVGAYFLGQSMGSDAGYQKGKQEAQAEFQQQAAEEQKKAKAEQLDMGELVEPEYKDETLDGEMGKQMQAADGLVLKITNVERNFKTDDPNHKLDPAKELIKVNFQIGSVQKDKAKDIASFAFKLESSSGAALSPANVASYEGKFDTVKLDPGTQMSQSIVYEVNKDEKPLKFIRSQVYRITNQNKEVTMKMVIPVAQ